MLRPSNSTRPLLGRSNPAAQCSSVLFPDPDAPTTAVKLPAANPTLTSARATVRPPPRPNQRDTPSNTTTSTRGGITPTTPGQLRANPPVQGCHPPRFGGDHGRHQAVYEGVVDVHGVHGPARELVQGGDDAFADLTGGHLVERAAQARTVRTHPPLVDRRRARPPAAGRRSSGRGG